MAKPILVPKPPPDLGKIAYYACKRVERNVERLRMLSRLTDIIDETKPGDLNPVAGAFAALIDAVADDLEIVSSLGEEVRNEG